jgi:Ca2+-binding RTX toxin-like protein
MTVELSTLNGTNGFRVTGEATGDRAGFSISGIGDLNGDGIDDFIVGAYTSDAGGADSGASYVVFGRTTGFPANFALSSLNGTNGFQISGASADDDSGFSVSRAGDVNGDNIEDLIIGAPSASGEGEAYVVFGRSTAFGADLNLSTLNGTTGFRIAGEAAGDRFGHAVSAAGDVNNDGFDDVIIGANLATGTDTGRAYVVFGKSTSFSATVNATSLTGSTGFRIDGSTDDQNTGLAVSGAGDINGDGIDDFVVGAPGDVDEGAAFVVFGRSNAFTSPLNLTALNGTNGFKINGEATADVFGYSVSKAGDINGDGIDDLVVGAIGANKAYVVFGKTSAFSSSLNIASLNGTTGFAINGASPNDQAGISVAGVGDVDGDGFDDLLVGAFFADANSATDSGRTYLLYGKAGGFSSSLNLGTLQNPDGVVINGFGANAFSGGTVSGADVNNDGRSDILIGAFGPGTTTGDAFVVFGSTGLGINPTEFNETIRGNNSGNNINGLGGADFIHGFGGNDTIFGGTSPDTINGGLGNDTLDGGTAFDTLDYSDRTDGGVNVNVINGVALTGGFINGSGFYQGGVQEDVISNFENIFGTSFRDRLIAGSTSARIEGRNGDDFLFAFSGNDTLLGGEGNDVIESNKSSDQIFGENGNDTLNGGTGLDMIDGGAGTDTADYANREGAVSVNLTTNIAMSAGALNSSGFYAGGFNEDQLVSIEAVFGSDFGDRLVAGNFASRLEGRGGNDNISGLAGNDTLIGGAGNDTLGGGSGNDTFELASGFGADRITDFVEGASVADVIRLVGLGAAFNTFAEVIAVASQSGADVVFNFGGGNTITVLSATVAGFNSNDFSFG